ncbi:RsmB/NOP family class I SAM-dependent RNA methyltransferase [Celeribacter marinus]|uniref:RsmB/NOP family class I SAM-dependent RNA methyltransferase n=1 Tax=Celeribacter marinus TaxID=1397108 RepID=UPI003F6B41AE
MTPTARLSAAIELLDTILSGVNAERALTNWARGNRYAGSKDRRAIRDYVFDAVRCLRSYAWLGGAGEAIPTGRQVMIGALRASGVDLDTLFTGERFSPEPLTDAERDVVTLDAATRGVRLDTPDWLLPKFDAALGADADAILAIGRERSPVFLRVNRRKATLGHAIEMLAEDNITAKPHALSDCALIVTEGARMVARAQAYLTGAVEVQDAGSQAVINALPVQDGQRVLDYCAGGGGKALALACKADVAVTAHDIDPTRMQDIAPRASRAGVTISTARAAQLEDSYDLIVADVPCSGSGSWSRAPQAKWALTPERLAELTELQAQILNEIAPRVAKGGVLGYITCSLFDVENSEQITGFIARHPAFKVETSRLITPIEGADGFFVCVLRHTG